MRWGDIEFVGLALLYGTLASLVLVGALWLCGVVRPWRALPFAALTLSFVFLTQHPFPAPGSLSCPVTTATPQLHPFNFVQTLHRMSQWYSTPQHYLGNRLLAATTMNFVICAAIGLALVRHVTSWRWIVLFGMGLTLAVELTQLSGVWGLYPCAYRQFNVDDLLLNALGVICGAALARIWRARQRAEVSGL